LLSDVVGPFDLYRDDANWSCVITGCESTCTSSESVGRSYVKTADVGWNIKTKICVQKIGYKNVHLFKFLSPTNSLFIKI
jgi:hypothetical protein